MPLKKRIALLMLTYLLGVATCVLVLLGAGVLGTQAPSALLTLGVVVGLMLTAAALVWLLNVSRDERSRKTPEDVAPPTPAAGGAEELPALNEFYSNTPDGRLGTTLATVPDLDPASDPSFAVELGNGDDDGG